MAMTPRLSADIARENNEALYGTASSAHVWFLVEYNGLYTSNAWEDAEIPQSVKTHLEAYPNSRQLLIRQPNRPRSENQSLSFFVVDACAETPVIYYLPFDSYDEILEFDIETIRSGSVVAPYDGVIYTVCTNGKRDACCSKYGIALYNAMIQHDPNDVWQASHIGGHRFAGTLYCFPHALCYGFLTENEGSIIMDAYAEGRILLDYLRGYAVLEKPLQAAEYFLRRELRNDSLHTIRVLSHEDDGSIMTVRFNVSGEAYAVEIQRAAPLQVIATTGDDFFKEVPQFKLIECRSI